MNDEVFMRERVEPCVEKHVDKRMEEHSEKTQQMQAQTMESMERFHKFQEEMTATIIGTLPPDPDKPSMWQALQDMIGWKKNVNKFLWMVAAVSITAIGGTVWAIIINSG